MVSSRRDPKEDEEEDRTNTEVGETLMREMGKSLVIQQEDEEEDNFREGFKFERGRATMLPNANAILLFLILLSSTSLVYMPMPRYPRSYFLPHLSFLFSFFTLSFFLSFFFLYYFLFSLI